MNEYWTDKDLVIQLHEMASKYDSEMLRSVADRMDFIIEERKKYGEYSGISVWKESAAAN